MATMLGTDYSQAQMSYDLRRLRLKGIIDRLEHSNSYLLTPDGLRIAVFYVKVHDRLHPLLADGPPAPPPVRQAFRTLERHVAGYVEQARMAA
ncbi:MAG: hypothetical protein DLM56_01240 [Pseudonocardiales bacterium]|nr:MAG: hypothetical protein DLM56_01240 [Pseudonocardiales bacterium]